MNANIQNICKNYKKIVECEFLDDDVFSIKLINYYKTSVDNTDFNNSDSVKRIQSLDNALSKYIDVENYSFTRKLKDRVDVSAVTVEGFSYLNEFMDYVITFSDEYENNQDTVIIQTKWL